MKTVLSGCPMAWKYRRASFAAESMASEPPLTRNTLLLGTGAKAATRSARSRAGLVAKSTKRVIGMEAFELVGNGLGHLGSSVSDV